MEYKYLCRQITNQCIIAMAKVGYIFNSEQYDTFTFDRAWMEKYGCCRIIEMAHFGGDTLLMLLKQ